MDGVLVAIGFTQFEALNFEPASFSKRSWAMNTWPRGNAQNLHIKAKKMHEFAHGKCFVFLLKILLNKISLCLPLCQVCGEVFFDNLGE
jgi:hypothetical protein